MNEVVYSQHSNITSGDTTRAMGLSFTPGHSSMESMPRKISYQHSRWSDRWKRYRKETGGTFGAKHDKYRMSEAVWDELNKA